MAPDGLDHASCLASNRLVPCKQCVKSATEFLKQLSQGKGCDMEAVKVDEKPQWVQEEMKVRALVSELVDEFNKDTPDYRKWDGYIPDNAAIEELPKVIQKIKEK